MRILIAAVVFAFAVSAEVNGEVDVKNVKFTLYTRKNDREGVEMFFGDKESIRNSGFNPELPVKIATHGYLANAKNSCVLGLGKAYLVNSDVNFIAVDWSRYAKNVLYEKAADAVRTVGPHVSKFLRFLRDETGTDVKKFHVLGHSLGAHVASFASDEFPNEKIGRITGFDPAAPLFDRLPKEERLDPSDAHIVDVIHTCIFFTGQRKPVGTVDFYPNGGMMQPGCAEFDLNCQHNMSHKYFTHTLKTGRNYQAVKCESLMEAVNQNCTGLEAPMGFGSDAAKSGIYHVKITESPFADP